MALYFDVELDLRGLSSVECVQRVMAALGELHDGQVLRVVADDPESLAGFRALDEQTAHELLRRLRTEEGDFLFYIEKR
ncbi:response regulator SirA [Sulfurifustis variabilis]|uniref:Response regulator SirA n=1 Tax=Sulfurifustis variabilis TaxID=1675686 RepID=A0A1B4V4D1_9GAMM|nr:sulfurtransferase TusA family protein [Sulfurifustis variabilis]BAU47412.1 response regulator SirA [Sulfurifustis variabilis]